MAELRAVARWPLAWVTLIAAGILSGITALVGAGASAQGPAPGSSTTAQIGEVMHLELLFGGILVAVGFGLLGAKPDRPDGTVDPDIRKRLARSIVLLLALAPALVIVHVAATIVVSLAPVAWDRAGGQPGDSSALGESTVLLLRGWLALLPFGAVGYALGAALRRPISGLLGATAFLFVDAVAGTVVSTPLETWWSPIGNAAALVGATTISEWVRAAGVTTAYVAASLALIARATAMRQSGLLGATIAASRPESAHEAEHKD